MLDPSWPSYPGKPGGVQPHAAPLKLYTEEMEPGVVCIQETWLRKDTKFEIEGYTISRTNQEPAEKEDGRSSLKRTSHMKEPSTSLTK